MSRFATLDSIRKRAEGDPDTNLYAGGGSEGGSGLAVEDPGSKGVTITMYRNGFMINNGEFRPLTDPADEEFVKQLMAGDVPPELRSFAKPSGEVPVAMRDKRGEDYEPPPPPAYVAFSGDGQSLGGGGTGVAPAAAVVTGTAAASSFEVDESKPKTSVQIRLHDGRRMVGTFNTDHPVAALQAFVASQTPGLTFTLTAGFPPKPLTDPSASLSAAGVAGAAVTQKLI